MSDETPKSDEGKDAEVPEEESKTEAPKVDEIEKTDDEKAAEIEAQMETKTDPSTSTLNLGGASADDVEEGEIKMVDPTDNPTDAESEKSEAYERKVRGLHIELC